MSDRLYYACLAFGFAAILGGALAVTGKRLDAHKPTITVHEVNQLQSARRESEEFRQLSIDLMNELAKYDPDNKLIDPHCITP
jgi:hypothetical protein